MQAMDIYVYFLCLFYFPLKFDPLKKILEKLKAMLTKT